MNKEFIKYCTIGFFSVFNFDFAQPKRVKDTSLIEYFCKIEDDLNLSFKKLKSEYERN